MLFPLKLTGIYYILIHMEIFRSILNFFKHHYWLFLIIIVFISYGQILQMDIWKDDNALFFKLFHIEERAGYFGTGMVGTGLYRFLVFPHYIIFKLFGAQQIWPFYLQALIFYMIATQAVYQLFKRLFSDNVGRLVGFLFASGYIASEGIVWLNESIVHSLSIILVSATLISFHYFSKQRKVLIYILTLILYCLTAYITPVRTQYFIAILIIFDLIWVVKNKNIQELKYWVARSIPFLIIFYLFYVPLADERTKVIPDYIRSLLSGQIYNLYSFFGTIGNMFFPDIEQNIFLQHFSNILQKPHMILFTKLSLLFLIGIYFIKSNKQKSKSLWGYIFIGLGVVWIYLTKLIITNPQITPSLQGELAVYIGGLVLLTLFFIWLYADKKLKWSIFFLTSWLVGNLFSYASYIPLGIYGTTERYITHSFVPMVGLMALIAISQKKKFIMILIIFFGVINIGNSIFYQHNIVENRSNVTRKFYQQLKVLLPTLNKGDVVYFDIGEGSTVNFSNVFSVGSMPETTALAWRYNLDRYDFQMFSDYADFKKVVFETPSNKIFSFWYSNESLKDTTPILREILNDTSTKNVKADLPKVLQEKIEKRDNHNVLSRSDLEINFKEPIVSIMPLELTFDIFATPLVISRDNFPLSSSLVNVEEDQSKSFSYASFKESVLEKALYTSSSDWQDRVINNSHDKDLSTVWEADRILWAKHDQYLEIDLKSAQNIDKFIWINGFSNNTPTKYVIETSLDGKNWQEVKSVNNQVRLDTVTPQVVSFNPIQARFIRMRMFETLNEDSPAIAEAWVSKTDFSSLNIVKTEDYLKHPFDSIPNQETFNSLLELSNYQSPVQISWKGDKSVLWKTTDLSSVSIIYDGLNRSYKVIISPGGTQINSLKISNLNIPGKIVINNISYKYLNQSK
jgi:hypothetical protein